MAKSSTAAAGPPSTPEEGKAKPRQAQFLWNGPTGFFSAAQLLLEHGKTYDSNRVDVDVLAEWIGTGHATLVDDKR